MKGHNLYAADVGITVALAHQNSRLHVAVVDEMKFRCPRADNSLSDCGAERAASKEHYPFARQPGRQRTGIAPIDDLRAVLEHVAPLQISGD